MDDDMELEQIPQRIFLDLLNDDPTEVNSENLKYDDMIPEFHVLEQLERDQIAFEVAVEEGDIATLIRLLEDEGKNLKDLYHDDKCSELLINALERGYFDVATILVSKGAPLNCRSDSGYTPLHIGASDEDAYEVVKYMLEKGADVNAEITLNSVRDYLNEETGDTPLHRAALYGNLNIVELLLKHGADVNLTNSHVTSPLIVAVKGRWTEITRVLLDHGANVHQTNINLPSLWSMTPLDWAMNQMFTYLGPENLCKVVHYFLSWEPEAISTAVISIPNEVQLQDAEMEELDKLLTIVELLVRKGASDDIIIQAMKFCYPEVSYKVTKTLIQHGAKMDVEDQRGISLMQVAACVGYYDLIKILLDNGAEVDRPNNCGWTPLMILLSGFREVKLEVVKLFIEYGANVNAKDEKGKTPLMIGIPAIVSTPSHFSIIEYLLDHGARVNVADAKGDTPLSRALIYRKRGDNDEIVKLLLERGAEVNTVNSEGNTPLHSAIINYETVGTNIIKMLLEHGADVNARDLEGNTPLMIAITLSSMSDVPLLLLEHGADINARNSIGLTPFKLAVIESRSNVITQLLVNRVQFNPKDLLDGELLVWLIIGRIPRRKKEVMEIRGLRHNRRMLNGRKRVVDSYIQKYHGQSDCGFKGRAFVALTESIRNSAIEIKCVTGMGNSSELLFTIVESRVLDLKLKKVPVQDRNLRSVISYRLKFGDDDGILWKTYNMMCNKEIRRMNLYRITDWIRLYDIITKNPKKAAAYLRNECVQRNLLKLYHRNNRDDGLLQFPIFANLINNHIQNVLARFKLVTAAQHCLNSIFQVSLRAEKQLSTNAPGTSRRNFPDSSNVQIPVIVADVIMRYMDDQDLVNLIIADCGISSDEINQLHADWEEELWRLLN